MRINIETVLVTAIGSFSADIVIKNLKKNGIRVIGCDIYPKEWIADSNSVDSFFKVPYATDEQSYRERILEICVEEKVNALVVLTDAEVDVLNRCRSDFLHVGVTLCLSSEETLELCRDKRKLFNFLKEKNIGNPIPTKELQSLDVEKVSYPVVIKPFNGRSSQGLHYIHSNKEMKAFLACKSLHEYVVQPFLKGNIITVDVVRQERTDLSVVICRKELLRTPNGAGTSVLVFSNPLLEEMSREIANKLQIQGCVNFEFIESEDGRYHMLECNPRFSGGVEFSCMAGYDCVINHLRCFTGEDIKSCGEIREMYIARKYEEYITKVNGEKGGNL
jgi:carbamoyl-phosphate synthase large subunit